VPQIERQIFANEGKYDFSLELINNQGKSFTKDMTIIVQNSNATMKVDKNSGYVGDTFRFTASTYFGSSTNTTYLWEIGDASGNKIASVEGSAMNYVFKNVGTYTVNLIVRSPNGTPDADSRTITVESREPHAGFRATTPDSAFPNRVLLDATESYDADTKTSD